VNTAPQLFPEYDMKLTINDMGADPAILNLGRLKSLREEEQHPKLISGLLHGCGGLGAGVLAVGFRETHVVAVQVALHSQAKA
jgi:hypothetical protein